MISVIIPAKEESATIRYLINKVSAFADEVIVVTSSIDTETINEIRDTVSIHVIEDRPGKGLALVAGAKIATGEILVFLDADLSHDPSDIPKICQPIVDGAVDLVTASRMLGGSSELFYNFSQFVRLSGSHLITLLINHKFKIKLTDSQNGFRAIKREVFDTLNLTEIHTTIEQEMTAQALRKGFTVIEVPSHEYARRFGVSKINVFKDGWRYIYVLFNIILKPKPRNWTKNMNSDLQSKYNPTWFGDFYGQK
jgi:glycosyltransferase involved in cell wall biosynthesis